MQNEDASNWSSQVETFYSKQRRELWALLYAYCSDADRATDALQEAVTRLCEQPPGTVHDLRAWVLRVGRNWLRDVARHQRVKSRTMSDPDLPQPGGVHLPVDVLQNEELREQVRAGLDELRNEDRTALILRYSLGWSSQRIATVLETTPSAVDMRLSRARKRLGKWLINAGVHPE